MVPVISEPSPADVRPTEATNAPHPLPAMVVKVGGGLLQIPGALDRVGTALAGAAGVRRVVVLPGGGPFADVVREFERTHGLSESAAHWMAIVGMDQYAYAIADHTAGSRVVEDWSGIQRAHREGAVPVLAPSRWLRAADELPHSWTVTSDSLAAYLATLLGIEELVLVKPADGIAGLTDPYFPRAVAAGMRWRVVSATSDCLEKALTG
jgi:5-(aminomethyl)-3-furanmethanol phosphate kinase